jgi:hypothetical protein
VDPNLDPHWPAPAKTVLWSITCRMLRSRPGRLRGRGSRDGKDGADRAEHTLTLDGQAGSDTYEIYTLGSQGPDTRNYLINVLDTGAPDDGVDELIIYGYDAPNSGDRSRVGPALSGR